MKYLKYIPVLTLAWTAQANAAVTMYVFESGGNVVATVTGTLNLSALTSYGSGGAARVSASDDRLYIGQATSHSTPLWKGTFSSNPDFGSGVSQIFADSGSGTGFGTNNGGLYVDESYVQGESLSATSTWNNTTLAGLGLKNGTYVQSWGSGANADSYTLNIGVVPEPTSMLLSMLAGGMMLIRRKR